VATKLFVGGLPYSITDDELQALFAPAGQVVSAKVIIDRETNRSKGFGFVEMASEEEAKAAIEKLHDTEVGGRMIAVSEAKPQERRERPAFNNGPRRDNNYEGRRY
jgi:cold-inducible RNA-binding protein